MACTRLVYMGSSCRINSSAPRFDPSSVDKTLVNLVKPEISANNTAPWVRVGRDSPLDNACRRSSGMKISMAVFCQVIRDFISSAKICILSSNDYNARKSTDRFPIEECVLAGEES